MPSRCPSCSAFVSVQPFINLQSDWVTCRACGRKIHCPSVFALASGTRRAETPEAAQGVACQSGPKGNAHTSHLQPNGKLSKRKLPKKPTFEQLDLLGGAL